MSKDASSSRTFNTKWLAPLGVLCAFLALWSFMMYPMLNGTPEHVPYAVVNLDEGASSSGVTVNAGDQIVDKLTAGANAGSDAESPIDWTVFDSKAKLDKAMDGNDYYGAIVIPKDFTTKQLESKQAEMQTALQQAQAQQELQQQLAQAKAQGATDEQIRNMQSEAAQQAQDGQASKQSDDESGPRIEIITNNAKNAAVSQQLVSSMTATLEKVGVSVKTTAVHDYDLGTTSGASMIGQLSAAPIVAMSASCTMIMFMMTRAEAGSSRRKRAKRFGIQIAYAAGLSLCVAGLACFLMGVIGGMALPWVTVLPFLWMCSFGIMTMLLGLMTALFPLGAVGMFVLMGTMSVGYIAPEMLPAFWHDWVLPWAPAHFVVDGVRSIVFLGEGVFNANAVWVAVCIAIGVIAAGIGLALPAGKRASDVPVDQTAGTAMTAVAIE